jgi:hypothetical protein
MASFVRGAGSVPVLPSPPQAKSSDAADMARTDRIACLTMRSLVFAGERIIAYLLARETTDRSTSKRYLLCAAI